jgi:chromosome segregation ATPase
MVRGLVIAGVAVVAASAGAAARARTQTTPDVLGALLTEVRGLRAAMERMASAGPRIELALGRLQLQEQRVNTLLRRQAELRERLADSERGAEMTGREIERLQDAVRDSSDENLRKEAEIQARQLKEQLGVMTADVQRFRAEEADIAQLLAAEQNRWTEINQRLEELERALTSR